MNTTIYSSLAAILFTIAAPSLGWNLHAAAPKDLKDKVVLANPQKYAVSIRLGKTQRNIEPKKATVLSPKQYPLTLEFWSGKADVGWTSSKIDAAGVYAFQWQGGQWSVSRRQATASKTPTTQRAVAGTSPSYRRSTGSYSNTVRGPAVRQRPWLLGQPPVMRRPPSYTRGWSGSRWPTWVRGVWGFGKLYQFIRDEQDRDLIRDIVIGGEIDDAVRREIEDALRDQIIALPHDEQRELERAIDDISRMNPDDWKEVATLPVEDWDRLRDEIGDEISDADWEGIGDWADTMDQPIGENLDLDEVGIDTMDENIDLGDLDDAVDGMDLDLGSDIEDIDLGDILGDAETMDLSDFGDEGYDGGSVLGDLLEGVGDGAADIGLSDLDLGDVGIDDLGGGGGWDDGGFDMDPGDYDGGGFDDFGGGWDDGGGFDDFGGGFDDGGGVDDFGGGFDDGGGDFFDF
jgi:hypothetical protein